MKNENDNNNIRSNISTSNGSNLPSLSFTPSRNRSSGGGGIPFTSSLHKSYIEDDNAGGKRYKIEFEIGDFTQNEINLSTRNNSLIVKGDREYKAGSATETKTFNRELTVPDYVDMEKMNAHLIENGPAQKTTSTVNNTLIIEAPIIMEKYTYRRSTLNNDKSQSPRRTFTTPIKNVEHSSSPGIRSNIGIGSGNRHEHVEETSKTTSSSHKSTTKTIINNDYETEPQFYTTSSLGRMPANHRTTHSHHTQSQRSTSPLTRSQNYISTSSSGVATNGQYMGSNSSSLNAPELIDGYPIYDNRECCCIYKFDFRGFNQSEIFLTITPDRTFEIKACKDTTDHLGRVYREFKREIQLEPEVDANLIKNLLQDGILTLKIPKDSNHPDNADRTHNILAPNGGFREFYTDEGKLAKLTSDMRDYDPENVKIILSTNNILKINAISQNVDNNNNNGVIQKECTRQYNLPSSINPDHMKAIMSRDGILTIDFMNKSNLSPSTDNKRVSIN
jgi:HSP20 family molecular chaperone IbpA